VQFTFATSFTGLERMSQIVNRNSQSQ